MDNALLEKKFPKLVVRNRTNEQKTIHYVDADGDGQPDSITVNGGATRPIPSKGLLQVPSIHEFELVSPTLFELQQAGVIQLGEQKPAERLTKGAASEPTIADSAVESGVVGNMNQRLTSEAADATNAVDDNTPQLPPRPLGTVPPEEKGQRPVTVQNNPRQRR